MSDEQTTMPQAAPEPESAPLAKTKADKIGRTLAVPESVRSLMNGGDAGAIAAALPEAMKPRANDFINAALVTIPSNPDLMKIAQSNPGSIITSLMECARVGLRPGVLGEAYLVPFGGKCQAIIGYRGLQKLALDSGKVRSLDAQCVYQGDECEIEQGDNPLVRHVPSLDAERDEEHCRGAYAVAELTSGQRMIEWMSKAEIAKIRSRSRSGGNGPWVSDWTEMARKTVVRRLAKRLPMPDDYASFDARYDAILVDSQPVNPAKAALTYKKGG